MFWRIHATYQAKTWESPEGIWQGQGGSLEARKLSENCLSNQIRKMGKFIPWKN